MQNLSPRHVKEEESLRLGVESGWYSTKVSGTFVSGPHSSEAECLRRIAEITPPPVAKRKGQAEKSKDRALHSERQNLMTLARGSIRGYDDDRMVLLFSMMDGTREVLCAVSGSAMDDLEHVPRTPADQREEQFTRLRDRIEACASRKFLAREFEGNPPCIIVRSIDLHPKPAGRA